MMLPNHDVEDFLRHGRKDNHHQCGNDRASQHAERDPRVTLQIAENPPNSLHLRVAVRYFARTTQWIAMHSPHDAIYTRLPECLCRSLKVSSAIPDLSSSPSPSAIIRSYCSLVARARGRSNPRLRASSRAIPLSLAACAAEKKQLCSRFCISSPSVSSTRDAAPVCEKTFLNVSKSRPSAAPSANPSANAAVLMLITMLTSAFTFAASPALQ